METETIEKTETAAEQRKAKAVGDLQKLETERASIATRIPETEKAIQRLDDDIVTAERAGTDPENLENLLAMRKSRLEQQQIPEDLARMLPGIDRELVLARAEVRAAEVAVHAEKYNEFVEQQRALTGVIEEAIHTIVETMKVKEGLARKQKAIHGDTGCAYPELSPAGIRFALEGTITQHIQAGEDTKKLPPFSRLDWTTRSVTNQGDLLPPQ